MIKMDFADFLVLEIKLEKYVYIFFAIPPLVNIL